MSKSNFSNLPISRIDGRPNTQKRVGIFLGAYGLLVMLAVLIIVFTFLNDHFLTLENFKALLEQNSALAIIAVGMTFAIISTNIDLAPGSLIALTGVIIGLVFQSTNNIALAIVVGFIGAILLDVFDGILIAKVGIAPLIVTLAAMIWMRGLAISLTNANSITIASPFIDFMHTFNIFGITMPLILVVICYLLGWFLLNHTRLGRYTYALGGDERAARQAGIKTDRYKIMMFAMLGFFAAVASVVNLGHLGAAVPNAAYGLELDAVVAVIIGGNPFTGGKGSIRRTIFGMLFIAVLNNGLSTLGMRDAYFYALKGLAILLAILFEVISRQMILASDEATSTI